MRELKEKVVRVMQWPAEKVKEVARRDNFHLSPNLSDLEHGHRPRRPLRGSQEEEGEEEEEEEEEEENQVPVWVPGVWVLLEVFLRGFLWETASGFILVFRFAWFDSGYMFGVAWCVSTALYLVATCLMLVLPEEYRFVDYSGRSLQMVPYSALSDLTVDTYFCQSSEAWWFSRTPA